MAEQKTFSTLVAEMEKEYAAKQPALTNQEIFQNQFQNHFQNQFQNQFPHHFQNPFANQFYNPFGFPVNGFLSPEEPAQPNDQEKPIPPPDCPCHLKKLLGQNPDIKQEAPAASIAASAATAAAATAAAATAAPAVTAASAATAATVAAQAAQEFKFDENAFSSPFFGIPSYNSGFNNFGYYGNSFNPFSNMGFANNFSFGSAFF